MKIIQSLWTNPLKISTPWCDVDYFFTTWILSCLRLHLYHANIELETDDCGFHIMSDLLELPYMKIGLSLNQIQNFTPSIWTMGKIYTYAKQKEPFIHVDGDVIIGEPLPFKEEALIAQHFEKDFPHNQKFLSLLIKKKYKFTPYLDLTSPNYVVKEINAGILGGTDMSFFETYTQIGFDFIHQNQKNYKKLKNPGMFNTLYEQYLFYCLCESLNHKVSYLLNDIDASFKHLCNFEDIPNSYIQHALSFYKKEFNIGESVSSSLFYLSEYHHNLIVEDFKNNVI
jgi:hypothetical protein